MTKPKAKAVGVPAAGSRCGAPGAPRGKREAIMEAAACLFLEQGYAATSMDAVTRRAGVSKATVYAHFKSKEELFSAIVRGRCEQEIGPAPPADLASLPPREALSAFGRAFAELVLSPDALGLYRVLIAEAPRTPELAETFYAAAPTFTYGILGELIEGWNRRGQLRAPDPRLMAEQLIAMIRADYYLRLLLGMAEPGDRKEIDRAVTGAVDTLMAAYGPKKGK
jgi:TetR/AcrR family transcriptional repressor of mexJK operon